MIDVPLVPEDQPVNAPRQRSTDLLWVLMHGRVAGQVTRDRGGALRFTYAPGYRSVIALSPSLPVGDRRFRDNEIRPYLDGLLPDNADVRLRWARQFGTTDHPFDLLAHMGQDCAGAVQFATEHDAARVGAGEGTHVTMTREEIGDRLRTLRRSASGDTWTAPDEHWSLAGAQGKFTLALIDGQWCDPLGAAASTHIVKPGVTRMRHQAAVEFATMRVARRLGLATAEVQLDDFDGEQAIVITRFDRNRAEDGIRRLHQVDLCQAIGASPALKYEEDGGPTARKLARLIRTTSTDADVDVRRFSDGLLFNYLSGSPDGHSKNFSLLYAGRSVRLAPLYDLATGLPYVNGEAAPRSAFAVGGVRHFAEAYTKHWKQHAEDFDLDPDERIERARELANVIPDAFHDVLRDELEADQGSRLWKRLTERPGKLIAQSRRTIRRLPAPASPS